MRKRVPRVLRRLCGDERAPTAVEYAILAGGIATVIVVAVAFFGGAVNALFLQLRW